jgi:hypothetical protein
MREMPTGRHRSKINAGGVVTDDCHGSARMKIPISSHHLGLGGEREINTGHVEPRGRRGTPEEPAVPPFAGTSERVSDGRRGRHQGRAAVRHPNLRAA